MSNTGVRRSRIYIPIGSCLKNSLDVAHKDEEIVLTNSKVVGKRVHDRQKLARDDLMSSASV